MTLNFTKMQAVGNNFVVCDEADLSGDSKDMAALVRSLCDRAFGIGADGVLLVGPAAEGSQFSMRIFNADGSEDTMCGNGLRCVARWAHARGRVGIEGVAQTRSGQIAFTLNSDDTVTLNLGIPIFDPKKIPVKAESALDIALPVPDLGELRLDAVNTGTTHTVAWGIWPEKPSLFEGISRWIETHPTFPERTSVLWTRVEDTHKLRIRIWERGVGETLACGTGACAAAVLALKRGKVEAGEITVASAGGEQRVRWEGEGHPVFLIGPATTVFQGQIQL
jgi:diaminopimelate epimerase